MIRTVSSQEINDTLFSMGDDKSMEPDGYTTEFFKEARDILVDDVIKSVQEFFTNGILLKELNHTIISFVPKVGSPSRINDYKPISYCNVLFKKISDNILLTQELMDNYHLDEVSLDVHLSVSNGVLYGFFKGKRGLRQGDPIYYYLVFTDDLFLYAHGDVSLAQVIMEVVDEFKLALGLVPSLPKSMTYFCNVLNYVKLTILHILPFEEGTLLVKYLEAFFGAKETCVEGKLKLPRRIVGWRKILQIHPLIQKFKWSRLGASTKASVWFDRCCSLSPLSQQVLVRDIHRAGFEILSRVKDVIDNGNWSWPNEWYSKYPSLNMITDSIRPRRDKISWNDLVWFSHTIPRHAFHLWLVIKRKLKTQDSRRQWDVWDHLKVYVRLPNVAASLDSFTNQLILMSRKISARSVIVKLVFAASSYFIWKDRNYRLFKNQKRSKDHLIKVIKSTVRLKLLTCKFKKTNSVEAFLASLEVTFHAHPILSLMVGQLCFEQ
ncbi:hypothetical protein Tco_0190935, partial [Tanacetum coccineum]